MAKLTLNLDCTTYDLMIDKVSSDKLYGATRKVARVGDQECALARLTEDGFIVPSGCTSGVYLKDGQALTKGELRTTTGGKKRPPTLDEARHLEPAAIEDLLEYNVHACYQVTGEIPVGDAVYKTQFSFSWAWEYRDAFLLETKQGMFLLVVEPARLQWISPSSEPLAHVDIAFDLDDIAWED